MSKFKLAFGIHNHQPVGNFESVFEQAHGQAYRPFLELVCKHKNFRMSLHQSGILWNWQKINHSEYFKLVSGMVKAGQLEIMTGGFFEPILPSIPQRDISGQIELLTKYIEKNFETIPNGLWLTERVWEPHLPEILSMCGIQYIPVDDAHFIYAGYDKSQLTGPFVSESNGCKVTLLPIQQRLRYLIPFGTMGELFTELREQSKINPDGLAVYADDGEKFGVWPETYKHCYEDGWLKAFFTEVEKNSEWLEIIPLSEAAVRSPAGRAYLPSASYAEMLHWALPAKTFMEYELFENQLKKSGDWEKFGRFVRGGHWRNFLSKYEESNLMHKKMLYVSNRLEELKVKHSSKAEAINSIKENLYAAQCNCPYWHGVFGGLYLPHIRQAVYANLIEAEQKLNSIEKSCGFSALETDFDCDGSREILISNDSFSTVFKPERGGMLLDLSLLKHNFNLTDTLSRRSEGYHLKLEKPSAYQNDDKTVSIHDRVKSKEEHLDRFLVRDWYLKRCFIDHFFSEKTTLDDFQRNKFKEDGDFILEPYESKIDQSGESLTLLRNGNLWRSSGSIRVQISKTFKFSPNIDCINITYEIKCLDNMETKVLFGVENNFNFQAAHADDRYILVDSIRSANSYLDSVGEYPKVQSFAMIDEYRQLAVAVDSDTSGQLWHLPIFTVSLSEGGFEKVYQGTTFVDLFEVTLSRTPVTFNFTLFAGGLKNLPEKYLPQNAFSSKN